jgi:imidazolonepropionase-like amidohydrolase
MECVVGVDRLAGIRERAERRVDVVKVMASGGATTTGTDALGCQFRLDELRLVVDGAHAAGLPVTAHTHALTGVEQARAAGTDGIERCGCLTESGRQITPDVVEALARQRVAVCPTLGQVPGLPPPPPFVALLELAHRHPP